MTTQTQTKPQAEIGDIVTDGNVTGIVIKVGLNKNKRIVYVVRRLKKDLTPWVHCEHWPVGEWESGFKIVRRGKK